MADPSDDSRRDFLYFPARGTITAPDLDDFPGLLTDEDGTLSHHEPDFGEIDPPLLLYLQNAFQSFHVGFVLEYDSLDHLLPFLDGLDDLFWAHRDGVQTLTDALAFLEERAEPALLRLSQGSRGSVVPRRRLAASLRRTYGRLHVPLPPTNLVPVSASQLFDQLAMSVHLLSATTPSEAVAADHHDSSAPAPQVPSGGPSEPASSMFPSRPSTPTPVSYDDSSALTGGLPPRLREAIVSYLQSEDIDLGGNHVLALFLRTPCTPYPYDTRPTNIIRNAQPPLNHLLPCLGIIESVLDAQRRHLQLARRRILRLEGFILRGLEDAVDEMTLCHANQDALLAIAREVEERAALADPDAQ